MTPLSRNQTPVSAVWSFFQPKSDEKRSKSLWIAEFHSRTRGRLLQKSLSPTIMHVDSTRPLMHVDSTCMWIRRAARARERRGVVRVGQLFFARRGGLTQG
jgi:hypothetical protein